MEVYQLVKLVHVLWEVNFIGIYLIIVQDAYDFAFTGTVTPIEQVPYIVSMQVREGVLKSSIFFTFSLPDNSEITLTDVVV